MANLNSLLKREFPIERHCTYLNHAAVAPWPKSAALAAIRLARESRDKGALDYRHWERTEQRLRGDFAALINAESDGEIALLKNTSEALSVVSQGFPWTAGDNVVICGQEFPSNRIVWEALEHAGVSVREVPLSGASDPEGRLLASCDAQTRILAISSVHYVTGLRLDLKRLGKECRRLNVAFCVDAIQGLGVFQHDVRAMQIDFLMADAHKWLLGPEGVAVFYCRPHWRERIKLHQFGWRMVENPVNFDEREWRVAANSRRFECGSPNMLGIHACAASIRLLLDIGIDRIEKRVLERSEYILETLSVLPELDCATNSETGRYAGIVTFRPKTQNVDALHRKLLAQKVACSLRSGNIRFSPHCYNNLNSIKRALRLCQKR